MKELEGLHLFKAKINQVNVFEESMADLKGKDEPDDEGERSG